MLHYTSSGDEAKEIMSPQIIKVERIKDTMITIIQALTDGKYYNQKPGLNSSTVASFPSLQCGQWVASCISERDSTISM